MCWYVIISKKYQPMKRAKNGIVCILYADVCICIEHNGRIHKKIETNSEEGQGGLEWKEGCSLSISFTSVSFYFA